jgi:glycosyltransferase involved in cell wall biosynthesis
MFRGGTARALLWTELKPIPKNAKKETIPVYILLIFPITSQNNILYKIKSMSSKGWKIFKFLSLWQFLRKWSFVPALSNSLN